MTQHTLSFCAGADPDGSAEGRMRRYPHVMLSARARASALPLHAHVRPSVHFSTPPLYDHRRHRP
jgi:hypothetical protein